MLYTSLDQIRDVPVSAVVIGNFDGVHRGHQALIDLALTRRTSDGIALALTFSPHPVRYFRGDDYPVFELMNDAQRAQRLCASGIDAVLCLPFSEVVGLSPKSFVATVLGDAIGASTVIVGYDFAFGKGRTGSFKDLQRLSARHQYEALCVDPVMHAGGPISSSRIRAHLRNAELNQALELVGGSIAIRGEVVPGDQRGREIGYATANIACSQLVPATGVYVTTLISGDDVYPSVTNIGTRPTYYPGDAPVVIEAHVLDAPPDLYLYDKTVDLELHQYLRPEIAYESTEALVAQIALDVEAAVEYHQGND